MIGIHWDEIKYLGARSGTLSANRSATMIDVCEPSVRRDISRNVSVRLRGRFWLSCVALLFFT